eukprot:jgi/Tetstr1/454646/TSEL_041537.t1
MLYPSGKRRTYVFDEQETLATPWTASLRARLHEAFGSDELGHRTLDLLSNTLTPDAQHQTLKSYADNLSRFAEFRHDFEDPSPPQANTATVVRGLGGVSCRVRDLHVDPYNITMHVYRDKGRAGRHGPDDLRVPLLPMSEHPRVARLMHHFIDNAGYWLRNCLPSEVEAFAEAVDATVLAAVEQVLGVSFDPSTYGTYTNPVVTDFLAELLHDPDPAHGSGGMWTVAIPTARTVMTPHELREVAAGYFFLPSPCLAPVVGSRIILPSTEHNPVIVDMYGDALMNLPAP